MRRNPVLQRQAPIDPLVGGAAVLRRPGHRDAARLVEFDALQVARPVDQPDRAIEVRLGEIGVLVGNEGETDIGVRLAEGCQPRSQPLRVEFARTGDRIAVGSLARLHGGDAFLELEEPFAQRVEARGAFLRQLQPLAGAAEQHRAEVILERADLLANGGGRHCQLVRGAGEGEMPRGGIVNAQGVERQVCTLHCALRHKCGSRRKQDATARPFL